MRIAVDARELCGRPTGVGRYLSELLTEWSADPEARRHQWRFYAHETPAVPEAFAADVRVLPGKGGTAWEQWTLARHLAAHRPDVLFAPGYTAPLTAPCPIVVTIHDVSFFAHPEWFPLREGVRRRTLTRWSARRATRVLTDSRFSQREISRHVNLHQGLTRVEPLGVRTWPALPDPPAREREVLYVGSLFQRRHVDVLVRVFLEQVAPALPDARLTIIGENRTRPHIDFGALLRASPNGERVWLRSYVTDQELRHAYARASVFVFLSEYEGFGLTPLEALAAGVPPIVLETPAAREIYGPAARYVESPAAAAHALGPLISELLTSASARQALLDSGTTVLRQYRWRRTAMATLAQLEAAAGLDPRLAPSRERVANER